MSSAYMYLHHNRRHIQYLSLICLLPRKQRHDRDVATQTRLASLALVMRLNQPYLNLRGRVSSMRKSRRVTTRVGRSAVITHETIMTSYRYTGSLMLRWPRVALVRYPGCDMDEYAVSRLQAEKVLPREACAGRPCKDRESLMGTMRMDQATILIISK